MSSKYAIFEKEREIEIMPLQSLTLDTHMKTWSSFFEKRSTCEPLDLIVGARFTAASLTFENDESLATS
jgi:hypothetical protein